MKLKLCTAFLAGLGLVAAANAQSSVSLYGVMDLALGHVTGSKSQLYGVSPQTNGVSRLGLRGSEDLGGGYRAAFNLESEIRPDDGTGAATGGGINFARAANVTLASPVGSFKMGRTLTPSYYAFSSWELTSGANYNVVNSQFGYTGQAIRQNAEFSYTTPEFAGLQAAVAHVLAANNNGVSKDDVNLIYRSGPVAAALSYNKLSNTGKNLALGGSYDFGSFRVAGSYQDARGAGKGQGYTLGVRVPVGLFSLGADLARDTDKGDTDWLLEARYFLSKRTFVYAAQISNGAGKVAKTVNTSVLGLRHDF